MNQPRTERGPHPLTRVLGALLLCALLIASLNAPLRAQTHKVAAAENVVRAVGVYEWTGEMAKAAASRLIPVSLFIDGKLDAEENGATRPLLSTHDRVLLGANSVQPDLEFPGLIDEVAIFARALSAEDVHGMFDAGSPIGPVRGESSKNK